MRTIVDDDGGDDDDDAQSTIVTMWATIVDPFQENWYWSARVRLSQAQN